MTKAKPESTPEAVKSKRALLRRAKGSEREFARWLQVNDGPDHKYDHLTTSTGRIGQLTGLQADTVSLHWLGENKDVKVPATLAKWWQLICTKADEWGKSPILHWEPSNGTLYKVNGRPLPHMYIIDRDRLEELLRKERMVDGEDS